MSAPHARQRVIPHEPSLIGHSHERADRVEQREKKEHEDDGDHLRSKGSHDVQFKKGWYDRGRSVHDALKLHKPKQPGGSAVVRMPISSAARTRCTKSLAITTSPNSATRVGGVRKFPNVTSVPGESTMTPGR